MPELDRPELGGLTDLLGLFLPLIAALVAWVFTANWLVTGGVLLVSIALVAVVAVLGKRKHSEASESEKEA
jgi:hypothetical protein